MLATSYTRYGLLCEGLSSQNVYREYALCESLQDDRAYCDTNVKFFFSAVGKHILLFRDIKRLFW